MPKIHYGSRRKFRGPWLLSEDALDELSEHFTAAQRALTRDREEAIKARIAQLDNDRGPNTPDKDQRIARVEAQEEAVTTEVSIVLAHGLSMSAASLAELEADTLQSSELPRGIEFNVKRGVWKSFKVSVSSGLSDSELEVSVPDGHPDGPIFLAQIARWADRHGPPWWQRWWLGISFMHLHWILFALLLWVIVIRVLMPDDPHRSERLAQAQHLIDGGVTIEEVPLALEVLLALQLRQPKTSTVDSSYRTLAVVLGLSFIICTIISIRPTTVIALARGKKSLQRWTIWIRLVWITLPALTFGTFLWPWIAELIRAAFH